MDAKWIWKYGCIALFKALLCFYSWLRLVPIGGQSISSEWVELGKLVPKVLVCLTDKYLMAGVIVGIEMSRKTQEGWANWLVALICTSFGYIQRLSATVTFWSAFSVNRAGWLGRAIECIPTGASRIEGCSPSNDLSTKDGKDELVQRRRSIIGTVRAFKRSWIQVWTIILYLGCLRT
jgi:hypothetical protein